MAIVKATYTRKKEGAKAAIRYIEHRPGKDGQKVARTLFGSDGAMGRWQAYSLIDSAEKGSFFYRLVISPDPKKEDVTKDLLLRSITEQTMQQLDERFNKHIAWVATEHNDHAPHRHIHVVAVIPERLQPNDCKTLIQTATGACVQQRKERDLIQEQSNEQRREAQWERSY
jgi:hypothetical protein